MKKMSLCILSLCCIVSAAAYQWPVENIVLTATFGESRWTHFHNGIDLGGGEQDIYPIDDGEVIFRFEENENPDALPSGMGSFIVLEHNQRIRSLYAHLKPWSMNVETNTFSKDTVLGRVGESGGSYGKHLHLTIIDGDFNQIINPLRVLPSRVDGLRPRIEGLYIKEKASISPLVSKMEMISGTFQLFLSVFDISEDVDYFLPMAPFSISLFLNGEEITGYTFEYIKRKDGKNVLFKSADVSFEEMYLDEWMISLGEIHFLPGETSLEVVVTDIAGNESIKLYKVLVVP